MTAEEIQSKLIEDLEWLPANFNIGTVVTSYEFSGSQQQFLNDAIASLDYPTIFNALQSLQPIIAPDYNPDDDDSTPDGLNIPQSLDKPQNIPVLKDGKVQYDAEGNYVTKVFGGHFTPQFVASFPSSLNTYQLKKIQDAAIDAKLVDEDYFGDEYDDQAGPLTYAFFNDIYAYADSELANTWNDQSQNYASTIDRINVTRQNRTQNYDVHTYIGGIDLSGENRPSDLNIIQGEIFFQALESALSEGIETFKKAEQISDEEYEKQIRANYAPKTQLQNEEWFSESYFNEFGFYPSDDYKGQVGREMGEKYNPYVKSLVALNKLVTADKVFNNEIRKVSGPLAGEPEFVTEQKLNPDYVAATEAQSPEQFAMDKIKIKRDKLTSLEDAAQAQRETERDMIAFFTGK